MTLFISALNRGVSNLILGGSSIGRGCLQNLRYRTLSSEVKSIPENADVSQALKIEKTLLEKAKHYVEDNTHKFGGWYYVTSLTVGAISVVSGIVYTCYRSLDNSFARRIDALDVRQTRRMDIFDNRMDALEKEITFVNKNIAELKADVSKDIAELKADFREIRIYLMQQNKQPIYTSPGKEKDSVR